MAWMNNDGLYIKFGLEEGKAGIGGTYEDIVGGQHVLDFVIDLTKLSTAAQTILDDNIKVPKGYKFDRIELFVETAATSGGAATLDIGLVQASDRTTEIDFDGLAAAVALSTINGAGKDQTLVVGSTGAGALIGTSASAVGHLVAKAGTAAFTAGAVRVRLYSHKP